MSVTSFKITDERVPLSHSIEKEKTIRHIGYLFSSYSVQKIQVEICLLLAELCERFVFFEVVCNMIPFCTVKLGYRNYQAAVLNLCFIGASILTRVFADWLADVCLGRNKLVHICLFLHFLGSALLSVAAFPLEDFYIGTHHLINNVPKKEKRRLFHVALLAICLGTGGIRAIVCPLGAYSLQECGFQKRTSLFNWFYWIMNLSATVVFLGISYIQHSGAWALVSLIPFMSTLMALITLYMMHYNLIYQPEKCCSLLTTFKVFVNALKTCCLQYCHLGGGVTSWLDHAKEKNDGRYSELPVEDTKFFFNFLPLFIFHLLYKTCIMQQIPSGYYLQTVNSNLNLRGSLLPVSVVKAVSILPLLILAPFMDYFSTGLLPSKRDGSFLSACVLAGNLSAALSVLVASFFEIYRKHFPPLEQPLSGKAVTVSSMPWSHLVLQYVLLGVAETLVNPACEYCNLNHFNAQNTSGSNLEETLPLQEKSLKFYGSTQEFSSSIDL
ncbi:hypothetical protein FD755_002091 [Muntiacus reevesi]|uniref:Solute carrier family 15 member 5 n=1 Tax=Muntiacus reevesi TaxID=9886 RepID=A0A5J5N3B6_MUNRE|nr:hypothetical protein FD755_002091 [Muntiacus reevesi]